MSELILQYQDRYRLTHAHRSKGPLTFLLSILDGTRYDEDSDMIALFFFSLQSKEDYDQGLTPDSNDCFWTEVFLSRQLAETDGWKKLRKKAKLKAMFHHAVKNLSAAKRKLRQVNLAWTPGTGIEKGPAAAEDGIDFPQLEPVVIGTETEDALRFQARAGAGL